VLILLPPSEGKSAPRRGTRLDLEALSFPSLTASREQALEALVTLCTGDVATAAAVLGLGPPLSELVARNAVLRTAPTTRADRLYTGVLYDALDLGTLDAAARRRASRWLAVTCSLFGLLRSHDRVPGYRLAGGVTLPGIGPVAGHWRPQLGSAVAEAVGSGLLVDLRSTTYAAFWRPGSDLAPRTATLRVLHEKDGRRSVVSHFNKVTKGRLVRALLEDGGTPRSVAELATQLGDLGFVVDSGTPGRGGTQLDVVVRSL
jgi:cytoplasmic iron level regulating protein YaaA (DUF328/UPF0246 family)